jgi:hypothetical protein
MFRNMFGMLNWTGNFSAVMISAVILLIKKKSMWNGVLYGPLKRLTP